MTAAMDVFTASGAGDEALVARLLEDGADCNLGDTWTGADICILVLCSAPSVPQPVVQSRRRPLLGPSPG